jgi:hypothetical protein
MWPRWNDLFSTLVCRPGLWNSSPGGHDANTYGRLARSDSEVLVLATAAVLAILVYYSAKKATGTNTILYHVVRASQFASLVVVASTIALTARRPRLEDYVTLLPVELRLLPHSIELDRTGSTGIQRIPVDDFEIEWVCHNDVCAFFVHGTNVHDTNQGASCGLCPIIASDGALVLRHDKRHGLWFFDGVDQNSAIHPPPPAQLAFRQSDVACVLPRDADIADSIRPPETRTVICELGGLGLLVLIALRRRQPSWTILGIVLMLLAIIPILPWIKLVLL